MSQRLLLRKEDFFSSATQAVAVADRYPQHIFAEHSHEFCELVMVWRGNGLQVLNGRPYRITCGDLFYIRADDVHSYESVQELLLHNVIYCPERLCFAADWHSLLNPPISGDRCWRLSEHGLNSARSLIRQLDEESHDDDPLSASLCESLFLQLAITLHRHRYQPLASALPTDGALLDKLMVTLAQSLENPFDVQQFCASERVSERSLRQLFRQHTGMTIHHYLRQLRLCQARYLLCHSELLVSDIAIRCGFEDSNYFSVVFTREMGMTPREWRQRHGEQKGVGQTVSVSAR